MTTEPSSIPEPNKAQRRIIQLVAETHLATGNGLEGRVIRHHFREFGRERVNEVLDSCVPTWLHHNPHAYPRDMYRLTLDGMLSSQRAGEIAFLIETVIEILRRLLPRPGVQKFTWNDIVQLAPRFEEVSDFAMATTVLATARLTGSGQSSYAQRTFEFEMPVDVEELSLCQDALQVASLRRAGAAPPPSQAESPTEAPVPAIDTNTHLGIITIKEEEFEAVLSAFEEGLGSTIEGRRRNYETATIETPKGRCRVAVTRSLLQGNLAAQDAAQDLIEDLRPDFVLVVGIAGGIPTEDFTLGDVIVSSFVHNLTLEDTGTGASRFNATGGPLHPEAARVVANLPALRRRMPDWGATIGRERPTVTGEHTTENQSWNDDIDTAFSAHTRSGRGFPIARTEAIGSSDRLVKHPELVEAWRNVIKGIKAVEMEVAGVYVACQAREVPCFAIRGISDIIGWRRDEGWTLYACATAAAFTHALAATGALIRSRGVQGPQ